MDSTEPKQDISSPPYKRWYDKQQTVSKSVKLLETFPVEYQEVLGDTIIRLAEKHCQVDELLANLRALGPDKVLSIFKAKSKSRGYDQNDTVHKAMNYIYVLPDEGRIFIATQVIEVVGHVYEYLMICRETSQAPATEIVQSLTNSFVRGQLKDTVEHLATFHPSMSLPNGPTLKSIRDEIRRGRSQNYQQDIEKFRSQQPVSRERPATQAKAENLHLTRNKPQSPEQTHETREAPVALNDATPAAETQKSGTSAPTVEVKPKELKEKDETLAQDNRGMKIKLDKFDL